MQVVSYSHQATRQTLRTRLSATESLHSQTNVSLLLTPGSHPSVFVSMSWPYQITHIRQDHRAFVSFCLTYCTQHNALKVRPCSCKWQSFLPCYNQLNTYTFIYIYLNTWVYTYTTPYLSVIYSTLRLLSCRGCCEECCSERGGAGVSSIR